MNLSPRNRLIATIAGCVLVLVVIFAVMILPQIQKLGSLNTQVGGAQSEAQAAKLLLEERQGFRDRALSNSTKWLRLMNQVPDTPDLASFIIELQDTAFKSGVQVVAVSPSEPVNDGAFSTIAVKVEVLGSWDDTVDYLEALPHLDRGVRLVNTSTALTTNLSSASRANSSLPRYPVDTSIGMETYMIASSTATASPNAKPAK